MIGISDVLQTRVDFDDLDALAESGEVCKEELARHYIGLQAGRYIYVFEKKLKEGDVVGREPEYLQITDSETGETSQLMRVNDPDARALKIGFTWDYIELRINDLTKG